MALKLLNEIKYGPLKGKYRQENKNREFKEALIKFLDNNVVSQLTIDCDRIEGNLAAAYDEDK